MTYARSALVVACCLLVLVAAKAASAGDYDYLLAPATACKHGRLEMLCLHNYARRVYGVAPLKRLPALYTATGKKADRMIACGTGFTHFPCGEDWAIYVKQQGLVGTAGENLAAGYPTIRATFLGWLNSEGHRANILDPRFQYYGAAFRPLGGPGISPRLWVTEFFGKEP